MAEPRSVSKIVAEIDSVSGALDRLAVVAEHEHTAPAELVAIMRDLRVSMIKAPVEVGGDHLHLVDQMTFFAGLAYWNPTAAWTGFNHAGAAGVAGARLDDRGVETIFGNDLSPFMAAVSAPSGTFRCVDGGIVLSGRWRYASGVPHSQWALLTAFGESSEGGIRIGIVPRADFSVHGEWNVMALRGTGSIDVVVDEAFVPDHLTFGPGSPIRRGGPMYALGYQAYVAPENLGFTLGVAQRFVDELAAYARGKSRGFDGRLADRGAFRYELGKAQLQIDAARGYARDEFRTVDDVLLSGHAPGAAVDARLGGVIACATDMVVGAVTNLFHFAGAGALFEASVLQRCFRDVVGSHQHLMASNTAFDRRGDEILAAG
jgi:alkylation response protein AidB-like acyl-CoA dehydrogenase